MKYENVINNLKMETYRINILYNILKSGMCPK